MKQGYEKLNEFKRDQYRFHYEMDQNLRKRMEELYSRLWGNNKLLGEEMRDALKELNSVRFHYNLNRDFLESMEEDLS